MKRIKQNKDCGWSKSWLVLWVAIIALALAACGGGGGGGEDASGGGGGLVVVVVGGGGEEEDASGGGVPLEPVEEPVILGQAGPGDVGNHIPFTVGNVWRFQGTVTVTGLPPKNFVNTITITETRLVNGVNVTVFQDTNPSNLGVPEETFLVKDVNGIADFGNNDPTDIITPQLVPFWEIRFPLETGSSFIQVDRKGIALGDDLDGDGINDLFDISSVVKMIGFEPVTVPVGTFANCAKIEQHAEFIFIMSSDGTRIPSNTVLTLWFAPNIGWVKKMVVLSAPSLEFTETSTEELIGFEVDGQTG